MKLQELQDWEASSKGKWRGMAFLYGYKTDGIFQNQEEVNTYVNSEGQTYQPNAKPEMFVLLISMVMA